MHALTRSLSFAQLLRAKAKLEAEDPNIWQELAAERADPGVPPRPRRTRTRHSTAAVCRSST